MPTGFPLSGIDPAQVEAARLKRERRERKKCEAWERMKAEFAAARRQP